MRHKRIKALGLVIYDLYVKSGFCIDLRCQFIQLIALFRLDRGSGVLTDAVPLLNDFHNIHFTSS